MLVTHFLAICSLALLTSASVRNTEDDSSSGIDSIAEDRAATLKISDQLLKQLSDDPTFRSFYNGLGHFKEYVPDKDEAIYSALGRVACGVIVYSNPIPNDMEFGPLGMCTFPCMNDSGFLFVNKRQDRQYSIAFFYQNSELMVAFLNEGKPIAGGSASCNSEGFPKILKRIYEIVNLIKSHPELEEAFSRIQEEYKFDSIAIREMISLAQFRFRHQLFPVVVKKIFDHERKEITFTDLPFSIGVNNGQIFVRDKTTGEPLHVKSSNKLSKENRTSVRLMSDDTYLILLGIFGFLVVYLSQNPWYGEQLSETICGACQHVCNISNQ